MSSTGAPHAKQGVLATLGRSEQRTRVSGEDRGEDGAGQPEEHEHSLCDPRVALGDLKRVGDVVDQVVLIRGHSQNCCCDLARLGYSGCRIGVQLRAIKQDVELFEGETVDLGVARGGGLLECRRYLIAVEVAADDDGVRHVFEALEVARLAALKERLGS